MRHLFKCSECGGFFEKEGMETLCKTCAVDKEVKKLAEVPEKKKTKAAIKK